MRDAAVIESTERPSYFCQPPDGDQMLDGVKFSITCQDRSRQAARTFSQPGSL